MQLSGSSNALLRLLAFVFAGFLASLLASSAVASPIAAVDSKEIIERAPAPDPYPDLATCAAHVNLGPDKTVFFSNMEQSSDGRTAPDRFAQSIGGATFKTAFGTQPGNPNKMFTDRWSGGGSRTYYPQFAQRASLVLAQKASGIVYVLLRDDPNGPRDDSVWSKIERTALEQNSAVTKIVKVNPADFSQQIDLWLPPTTASRMSKRDVPGGIILDWPAPADGPYWLNPGQ